MMKFLYIVLILSVVTTRCLSQNCESIAMDCNSKMANLNDKSQPKEYCQVVTKCTQQMKECPIGDVGKQMLEMLEEKLAEVCSGAGFIQNNLWILAASLFVLIAMRKHTSV